MARIGRDSGIDAGAQHPSVDIVIPVYGAARELDRCLTSVLRHTRMPPHGLIVIVDGPQPPAVDEVLDRHLGRPSQQIQVHHQQARAGFVAAVNQGMMLSKHDVVLLNSDTEVTSEWIEHLQAAAASKPGIATVTPLSNNATICSLPETLEDNLLPAGFSADSMAEVVSSVAHRGYASLPTGVGVCLFITREAIEAIGLFNQSQFGLGYGEENEFCIRATRMGFEHVVDDATFIYHAGHRSFGTDSTRRKRRGIRTLRSIDPSYIPRVARFIEADPLRATRERVVAELRRRRGLAERRHGPDVLSVLHVVHGWPPFAVGGTEQYAWQLSREQTRRHRVAAFSRISDRSRMTGDRIAYLDHDVRVRFVVNNFDQRNPIARNALKDRRFDGQLGLFLDQTRPDVVHVHHLAGHSASLMGTIERRSIPIVYQVQDWWPLCARANLWRPDDSLCSGPTARACAACLPMTGLHPRTPLNRVLYLARRLYLARQVRKASAYVMGSQTVLEWHRTAGFLSRRANTHVLNYGVPGTFSGRAQKKARSEPEPPIVFGFIGALMPHKGAHVVAEAFLGIDPAGARLDIWGNPDACPAYSAQLAERAISGPVDFRGRFDEEQKTAIFESIDVLVVPSVGLESFGIVAREAMAAGVPVLASRRGALQELEIDDVCGATIVPGDAGEIRRWVHRLIGDPTILGQWRRNLPRQTTVESHAAAIDDIYRQVLGHLR